MEATVDKIKMEAGDSIQDLEIPPLCLRTIMTRMEAGDSTQELEVQAPAIMEIIIQVLAMRSIQEDQTTTMKINICIRNPIMLVFVYCTYKFINLSLILLKKAKNS